LKRTRIIILMVIIALLCCGFTAEGNLVPSDAYAQNENPFWTAAGDEGFTFQTDGEDRFTLSLAQEGYGCATCVLDVQPKTIYRITYMAASSGEDALYCIPEELSDSTSPICKSADETEITFYGLTSPDQTTLELSFFLGSLEEPALGTGSIAQLSVVPVKDVPESAHYVWLYDVDLWQMEHTEESSDANVNAIGMDVALVLIGSLAFLLLIFSLIRNGYFDAPVFTDHRSGRGVWIILGFGVLFSVVLGYVTFGHPTDMVNFSSWALHAGKVGLPDFYISGMWADYPPGYIYVLYVVGLMGNLLGLKVGMPLFNLMIKLPSILCDAACGYFIYRIAKKYMGEKGALKLCALYVFNPLIIFNSAIWGQMDGVLVLITVLMMYAYLQDHKPLCAFWFVLGVLVKPQMLIFGPMMLIAFVADIIRAPKEEGLKTLLAIGAGIATLVLLVLPFTLKQHPLWILDKYTSAAGLYPYATVNAFNFYALLGANWLADSTVMLFGISYRFMGIASIVIVCLNAGGMYLYAKEKRALVPVSAFTVWGIFAFAHNMHERYLFPAVLLLLWAFLLYRQRRLLYCFTVASVVTLLNAVLILLYPTGALPYGVIALCSLWNLIGFFYCGYVVFSICRGEDAPDDALEDPLDDPHSDDHAGGEDAKVRAAYAYTRQQRPNPDARRQGGISKKDALIMAAITLVYAVVSLTNLGSTQVPSSYWREREAGAEYILDLGRETELSHLYYYPGIGDGAFEAAYSLDGKEFTHSISVLTKEADMYTWQRVDAPHTARYIRIKVLQPEVFINEMGIYDAKGNLCSVTASGKITALFDEQELIDLSPGYLTEMYFDEIYHARTAYEHLLGMAPYENSHPPLGKIFISLGILIFGMNPFGWRIIGALFGIGILPLFYGLTKRIFKRTDLAAFGTLLLALDGMLFVQSRIATIDTYGVFFILLMCYFMYRYYEMSFYSDGLLNTLIPLGLCGISFGLGIASKWIGFYAGAGLAVTFFYVLFVRFKEYRAAKYLVEQGLGDDSHCHMVDVFWGHTIKTLLFCCGFFIVVPAAIYLASYLPYFLCAEKPYDLNGVIGVQEFMLSYHGNLTATHPYQSPWYQWPLMTRPIWFYSGSNVAEGMMSSIASFGNPLVWWGGLLFTLYSIISYHRRNRHEKKALRFIFIALAAAFLPWTLISRATFLYHYFASVPFIILLTVFGFRWVEIRTGCKWAKWAYAAACLGLFIMFYPVWSAAPINMEWAMRYLQWMPSWWFF